MVDEYSKLSDEQIRLLEIVKKSKALKFSTIEIQIQDGVAVYATITEKIKLVR